MEGCEVWGWGVACHELGWEEGRGAQVTFSALDFVDSTTNSLKGLIDTLRTV